VHQNSPLFDEIGRTVSIGLKAWNVISFRRALSLYPHRPLLLPPGVDPLADFSLGEILTPVIMGLRLWSRTHTMTVWTEIHSMTIITSLLLLWHDSSLSFRRLPLRNVTCGYFPSRIWDYLTTKSRICDRITDQIRFLLCLRIAALVVEMWFVLFELV